jgi:hypothetical protein
LKGGNTVLALLVLQQMQESYRMSMTVKKFLERVQERHSPAAFEGVMDLIVLLDKYGSTTCSKLVTEIRAEMVVQTALLKEKIVKNASSGPKE